VPVVATLAAALAAVEQRRRLIRHNEPQGILMKSSDPHCSPFSASRLARLVGMPLFGLALFALAGCNTISEVTAVPAVDQVAPTVPVQNAGDIKYYPSDEPLKLGLEYFKKGSYGIANRYFRDAVEKAPKDPEAWIGLAASYDRLRRFDLADQAYAAAIKLTGETLEILNDRGYSYMLRGDLTKARVKFLKAYQLDPTNPTVINNLQLLNASYRFIERAP
jgi:tetratricopeptide (TPR) repeat protein